VIKSVRTALVGFALILIVPLLTGTPAKAMPGLTYQEIAALPPVELAAILNPLRTVASAASAVGYREWSNIFSGVRIDAPGDRVIIYLTDPSRAADFLRSAGAQDPSAEMTLTVIKKGTYTRLALNQAASVLLAQHDLGLESVTVPPEGNDLEVRAFDVASARAALDRPGAMLESCG
jgi:hypothetical protein